MASCWRGAWEWGAFASPGPTALRNARALREACAREVGPRARVALAVASYLRGSAKDAVVAEAGGLVAFTEALEVFRGGGVDALAGLAGGRLVTFEMRLLDAMAAQFERDGEDAKARRLAIVRARVGTSDDRACAEALGVETALVSRVFASWRRSGRLVAVGGRDAVLSKDDVEAVRGWVEAGRPSAEGARPYGYGDVQAFCETRFGVAFDARTVANMLRKAGIRLKVRR